MARYQFIRLSAATEECITQGSNAQAGNQAIVSQTDLAAARDGIAVSAKRSGNGSEGCKNQQD